MKIADIYSAKGLKIKFTYEDTSANFEKGDLIRIDKTQKEREYLVTKYANKEESSAITVLCLTDHVASDYLIDLFNGENSDVIRCLFTIEGVEKAYIEIQAYTFNTITEYKTPIYVQVPAETLENIRLLKTEGMSAEEIKKAKLDRLATEYIWDQLGEPALFGLNYKNKKKQRDNIRFVSGRHYLYALNTPRGIIVEGESNLKERYEVPVDIYVAPKVIFVEDTDSLQINEGFSADLDKVSNSASYFARWEAYNELSKKLIKKESEEFGEINYTEFSEKIDIAGTAYFFEIDQELDDTFVGKDVGVLPKTNVTSDGPKPRLLPVGTIRKIVGKRIITYREETDTFALIPVSGVLTLYTAGEKLIAARRDAARERMVKHASPIKSIVALIEAGASDYELPSSWSSHKAITEELKKNYPKAKTLNPDQERAVNVAINSPDIALIQGPPGTGKTTVIKAICERYREVYEDDERRWKKEDEDHIIRSPKILISSFQNEAVDNAISTPLPGDIPAYRKMARRAKDSSQEQYQRALDEWYGKLCQAINESMPNRAAADYVAKKSALNDELLSYRNAGEPLEMAASIMKHYLSFEGINYPQELVSAANKIIKAGLRESIDEDVPDPIVARLETQRLTEDVFADDGARNARRLLAHIKLRDDLVTNKDTVAKIEAVCNEGFTRDEFITYVEEIRELKKRFCKHKVHIDVKDKRVINECILVMAECFENQYINQLSDVESKKSVILSEFISKLEQEYETVVRKYSMTTAATCQTSYDFRETDKSYDLVIIDEAARANPLDLFIPMSMGKKIVMVGDHKQLPHMLEPDVLQLIKDDPKFKDLSELEKSLFERMFDMFLKGNKAKSIPLTYQYRMHPDICSFVSAAFYDEVLKTAPELAADPNFRKSPESINEGRALTLVNIPITHGAEIPGASKSREFEASIVCSDVKKILETETNPEVKIGVITFYSAQTKLINEKLILNEDEKDRVEVGTVDAFQGKEFDYVLLSCVRSNVARGKEGLHDVGFLDKPNRLCVAFSRARKQLAVYGDMETLIQIPYFEKLYNICALEEGGCYREY
jgi:hypothetical protein